jgi:hypothetical protein
MKKFKSLRNKMPPGEHVSDKKISGFQVMVHKDKGKFVAYVDGDDLILIDHKAEAEKAATQFVKQFGKMK